MQWVPLKNFNFKIVKKIEQVTENKHKKFSQNLVEGYSASLDVVKS